MTISFFFVSSGDFTLLSDLRDVGGRNTAVIPNPLLIFCVLLLTPQVYGVAKILMSLSVYE